MARSLQFVGIPEDAVTYLHEQEAIQVAKTKIPDASFGDITLYTYRLNNNEIVSEVIQKEFWSSGPVIFTKLIKQPNLEELFTWDNRYFEDYE